MLLTARQSRELDFHRSRASEHRALCTQRVALEVLSSSARRPWNAYWSLYDLILAADPRGKRVLVPGCGFGEDAIRLAALGAEVSAFDLSDESLEIAAARARLHGLEIQFGTMGAEALAYPEGSFDAVVLVDILHHVDIPAAMSELRRVLKPGGLVLGDELYTHSALERFRQSRFISTVVYPRMVRLIYGTDHPYITADEHKIDEHEFATVTSGLTGLRVQHFNALVGRIVPDRYERIARLDRVALRSIGPLRRFLGGRIVFSGHICGGSHGKAQHGSPN